MSSLHPKIDIHKLREIGWSLWDPIGLNHPAGVWREEPFADEYDSYLLKAAGMVRNQINVDEIIQYLFLIETDTMGLGPVKDENKCRKRLRDVVRAISNNPSIWSDGENSNLISNS